MEFLDEARASLQSYKDADADRYHFVENLLAHIHEIQSENKALKTQLEDSEYSRGNYRRDYDNAKRELREFDAIMKRRPFALVLVDGDGALFRDEFVQEGESGGDTAVRELRNAVFKHLASKEDAAHGFDILIRVYSKIKYFEKTYREQNIIKGPNSLADFVQGFNRVYPLCEYVNAGNDKEGADTKVQETMKLFVDNIHCKHVILCASSDQSYTGFLRQYVDHSRKHITLVESVPFPHTLAVVARQFPQVRFDSVFRDAKLLSNDPDSAAQKGQEALASRPSYATTLSQSPNGTADRPSASMQPMLVKNGTVPHHNGLQRLAAIPVNKDNHRVDSKLPYYDKSLVESLKHRQLCNRYYLSYCPGCNESTNFDHESRLSVPEINALRFIARWSPCRTGGDCRDRHCVAAHVCIYGVKCNVPNTCRYPLEMHGVDPVVVEESPAWPDIYAGVSRAG